MKLPRSSLLALLLPSLAPNAVAQAVWQTVAITGPAPRSNAAIAFDSHRQVVVLSGGFDGFGNFTDTWEWNGTTWTQRLTATTPVPGAAMCYDRGRQRIVMVGATIGFPTTWEYDGVNWQQRLITQPPMSGGDLLAFDERRQLTVLFVQGGGTGGGSTWEYDGVAWVQRFAPNAQMLRTAGNMVYDLHRQCVVLQGGVSLPGAMPAEWTWEYDGGAWIGYQNMNAAPCNDHAFAFDAYRRRAVKVGGIGPVNGTCEYDGPAGMQWINSLAGPIRGGAAMAYDSTRRECVLFGGRDLATNARFGDTQVYRTNHPATATGYGQACSGAGGAADLYSRTWHVPYIGMPFDLVVTPTIAHQPALLAFGTSNTNWNGVPLPLSLQMIGMPGCFLRTSPDVTLAMTGLGWFLTTSIPIPLEGHLVGTDFYLQAFAFEPGANPAGLISSRGLECRIGMP